MVTIWGAWGAQDVCLTGASVRERLAVTEAQQSEVTVQEDGPPSRSSSGQGAPISRSPESPRDQGGVGQREGEQTTRWSEGMLLAASRALLLRDPQGLSGESSHGISETLP